MNFKTLNQNGQLEIFAVAIIILIITILGNFYKELFVDQSGSFQIFGNLGLFLVVGLLQRWKHIGKVISVWTFIAIIGILTGFLMSKSLTLSYFILLLGLLLAFYLTTFSSGVKVYLNQS